MSRETTSPLSNVLDSRQHKQLAKIQRFLTNVADPVIVSRAVLHGYDDDEHAQGWSLYSQATGMSRPLSFFVSAKAQTASSVDDQTKTLLRLLDQFENKWFPRIASALDRYVKGAGEAAFVLAFFEGLVQQPEGPLVVDSVTMLLDRVEALAESEVAGAKEAFKSLEKRGLTVAVRAEVRAQLASVRQLRPSLVSSSSPAVDLAGAALDQQAAYQKLVSWYRDWATTFRQELDHHALVRLGLRSSRPEPDPEDTP